MSQNPNNNTATHGTSSKETDQPSAQGAAPNTTNGADSANVGRSRNHTRRSSPSDLIIVEASDKTPKEDPATTHRRNRRCSPSDRALIDLSDVIPEEESVMVSHEEAIVDEEWIKDFPKEDQKEADNAQGPRV
ncbi:hypothetical protein NCS55_00454100 [Fusarium keratoplasticum]|nr:hypothetical protein NCS55_00454100 [Fusarium keratoplasticum]